MAVEDVRRPRAPSYAEQTDDVGIGLAPNMAVGFVQIVGGCGHSRSTERRCLAGGKAGLGMLRGGEERKPWCVRVPPPEDYLSQWVLEWPRKALFIDCWRARRPLDKLTGRCDVSSRPLRPACRRVHGVGSKLKFKDCEFRSDMKEVVFVGFFFLSRHFQNSLPHQHCPHILTFSFHPSHNE